MLALLFGQPERSFFASELIELTGSGAVQRELRRLASSGLVTIRRVGKQKHYQANPDCPVFEDLCALVRKTIAMVEPIRQALAPPLYTRAEFESRRAAGNAFLNRVLGGEHLVLIGSTDVAV